jgi:hypothetical protein
VQKNKTPRSARTEGIIKRSEADSLKEMGLSENKHIQVKICEICIVSIGTTLFAFSRTILWIVRLSHQTGFSWLY